MDAATLAKAIGCPIARAEMYVSDFNRAMLQAGCTTINRAAMWCAQIGHESMGLRYMEELADGSAYEGRKDLRNTQPGDGRRFKGRGPIQLTGRWNYTRFSQWAKANGLVREDNYFVNNPREVATARWGFLAAAWYWTVERPGLNGAADKGDYLLASQMVNGFVAKPNGLADRLQRWQRALQLGPDILPVDPRAADAKLDPTPGGLVIPIQLPATPPPAKGDADDSNRWPQREETIDLGFVGGWHGRCIVRASVGHPGGRIFSAHFDVAAGARSIVHPRTERPGQWVDPAHSAGVRWKGEAPTGEVALMIAYAAPGGLSLSVEWEK